MAKKPLSTVFNTLLLERKRLEAGIHATARHMADEVTEEIKRRTFSGRGVDGRFFKGYSDRYATRKKGRRAPVTLVLSGDMMRSLQPRAGRHGSWLIAFRDNRMKRRAAYHNYGTSGRRAVPQREWFGVTGRQGDRILKKHQMRVMIDWSKIPFRGKKFHIVLG